MAWLTNTLYIGNDIENKLHKFIKFTSHAQSIYIHHIFVSISHITSQGQMFISKTLSYILLGPCPSQGALVNGVGLLSQGSKEVKTQMCMEIISPEFDQQVGEKKCVPGCLGNYMAVRQTHFWLLWQHVGIHSN